MVFFYNSLIAQVLLNGYYAFRLARHKSIPKALKVVLYVLIALEIIMYLAGLFFREQLNIETYAFIQKVNVFWVIGSLYFLFILFFFDGIYYLNKKWIFRIQFKRKTLFIVEILLTVLFAYFIERKIQIAKDNYAEPNVKEFSFSFQSPDTTTHTTSSYKLLVVSDLHLGYIINKPVLKKYVNVINSQNPDIIVIDGDLIDYFLDPLIEEKMDEELKQLRAPLGVYFVPGNHEYKLDPEANFDWIRKSGITVLKDSVANINNDLYLIGWDDWKNRKNRVDLDKLLESVPCKETSVLLVHQPADIAEAYKQQIPLTVCGHIHSGQLFPANYGHLFKHYFYGIYEKDGYYAYVTSGIGLSGFPLKIMSDSEIAVFNIEIK